MVGNKVVKFTCPKCKRPVEKRVSELKRSDQKCPHCGTKYETSDFKHGMDEVEREIDRFKRNLGNIKIDIKL